MDSNGNLSIPERRALRKGDIVVYQTEGTAHRGEQRGRVHHVGESGIVWIGTTGSRYALITDYVARADWTPEKSSCAAARDEFRRDIEPPRERLAKWLEWKRNALGPVTTAPNFPPVAAPEPSRGVEAGRTGKDTPKAPDAPAGQEMASAGVTDQETGLLMAPAVKGVTDELRAQVAALTVERDIARNHWRTVKQTIREISERLMEVTHE